MTSAAKSSEVEGLRIDRWLWCARFFKTRSLAVVAIRRGHIRLNGERTKPSREVNSGDHVSIVRGPAAVDVNVVALPSRRGPAALSAQIFEETEDSVERRERARLSRAIQPRRPTDGKPDKRTRRLLRSQQRSIL